MKSISKSLVRPISLAILCLTSACSTTPSVAVKTDYDHAAKFGKYHTYAVDSGAIALSPAGNAALQSSLRSALAARGFTEKTGGKADFYIVSTVFTQDKLHALPASGATIFPSHYGPYGMARVGMNVDVTQYTEGSLVIDFVDSKTHKLIFRGVGQAIVGSSERNAAAIRSAVEKIVAAYPK